MQILQKIQDSFPCTYMHVQVTTSYFKMLKQVSLYSKQFPIVGCGQISLLMPKTHSTVQRGSNSLFNETIPSIPNYIIYTFVLTLYLFTLYSCSARFSLDL